MNDGHTVELAAVTQAMRAERLVALAIHENPDSDAVGAAVGMLDLFEQLGVAGRIHISPAQPLPIAEAFIGADYVSHELPPAGATLYAIDCGSFDRLALPVDAWEGTIVNIDHHHDNTAYGSLNLICPEASSASEIVCDIAATLALSFRPWAANALYAGISFDTGHFRHQNTSSHALACAASLVEAGADPRRIYQLLYETRTLPTLRLWARALSSVIAVAGGRGLIAVLDEVDYRETGADHNETEGIVDFLRSIHGVSVAALVKQHGDSETTRASLRSHGIDVSALAALRGGGGHREAAGFSTAGDPKEVAGWLSTELEKLLSTGSC
jgi:bifunctional oligoribonuclease and PAP phosphatase NrnA